MNIINCNINMFVMKVVRQNSHISYEERVQIQRLIEENYSTKDISNAINRPLRTVQDEIKNRRIYQLRGTFCKDCKNNKTCDMASHCEVRQAYGSCGVAECEKCPKPTCNNFVRIVKCPNSNKCNTCNGCEKLYKCTNHKILYTYSAAQADYVKKRANSKQELKINKAPSGIIEYIKDGILKKKYSPDALTGRMKAFPEKFQNFTISTQTIYSAINKSLIPGVTNLDLKLKCRYRVKKEKPVSTGDNKHRIGREIDKRQGEEIAPTTLGHYELDLVEGIKGGELLLTFIDRFSSDFYMRKIKDKSQDSVYVALNSIKLDIHRKYGKNIVKSITTDNGSEFKNFIQLEESCLKDGDNCKVFYAMPYCPWQKGKIEQANWVLGTYITKGTDISKYSNFDIAKIQDTINNMPRKRLGYLTANEYSKLTMEKVA